MGGLLTASRANQFGNTARSANRKRKIQKNDHKKERAPINPDILMFDFTVNWGRIEVMNLLFYKSMEKWLDGDFDAKADTKIYY